MPSNKKSTSPKTTSPKLVERDHTANEKKKLKARFDFSKYPIDKTVENPAPMKKRLTATEFRDLMHTIYEDVRNSFLVTSQAYGAKEQYHTWTKTLAKQYVVAIRERLNMAYQYYKYHPRSEKKAELKNPPQLLQTLLVFQNFKDWINNVNMGNGLAQFMIHRNENPKFDPSDEKSKAKKYLYSVTDFIDMANEKLKEPTSLKEINRLLRFHPKDQEGDDKHVFDADVGSDDNFVRILAIINAYREVGGVSPFSEKEALAHLIPQKAQLGKSDKFNAQEVLNMNITTSDGAEHTSAAINPGMSIIIMTLMANANHLYNKEQTKYVDYKYFNKYFGGTDDKYAPTKGTGFYLDGEDLMTTSFIKGLPKRSERTKDAVEAVVRKAMGPDVKPSALENVVSHIADTANKNSTALSFAAAGGRKKKSDSESKAVIDGVGVRTYTATQLAFYNRIPNFLLSEETKAAILGDDLTKRVKYVQKHFSAINEVYTLYAKMIQRAEEKDKKAKNKKPSTPGKSKSRKEVVKSPGRVAGSPTAASPKRGAASPTKNSSKSSPKSSSKSSPKPSASPKNGSPKSEKTKRKENSPSE